MGRKLDIRVVSGVSAGDVFHFVVSEEQTLTIGRDPGCALVLQDPMVSRRHAAIEARGEKLFIVDTNSSQGTFHMGFRLVPGPEGKRELSSGDEFKIGETIFSLRLEQEIEAKPETECFPCSKSKFRASNTQRIAFYLLLFVVVLGGLYLASGPEQEALPPQKSEMVLLPPEYRLIGYWPGGANTPASQKDSSHLDKAQFSLPTSNVLVEYDYFGESDVQIFLDEELMETLKPTSIQRRVLVVRDVMSGSSQRLVFDNLDYPRTDGGSEKAKLKRWAVRNVRATPLSLEPGATVDSVLSQALSLMVRVDTTPEALFTALRAMQRVVLLALTEAAVGAVEFSVEPNDESASADSAFQPDGIAAQLRAIQEERRASGGLSATPMLQLNRLQEIVSKLDSELWRRVNSRTTAARYAAQAKDNIKAYDHLLAVQSMFPDQSDYRWTKAQRMIEDPTVVPKKIRANASKFRNQKGK